MTTNPTDTQRALGQFNTPGWAAELLTEKYFGDLTMFDRVIEPSCGEGAFLNAIPSHVPAIGVEIDPRLAQLARRNTGREVIVGNFRDVDLPFRPTVILGNPPFQQRVIQAFLNRAFEILPQEGRVGLILPCFSLQTASVVDKLARRWSMQQDLIPRNIFHRLIPPLCFAVLTKTHNRKLIGFSLYHETHAVSQLRKRYRALLQNGERSMWAAVVTAALEESGGTASLTQLYQRIANDRPTTNPWWRAKVRQTVQRVASRVGPAQWALPVAKAA